MRSVNTLVSIIQRYYPRHEPGHPNTTHTQDETYQYPAINTIIDLEQNSAANPNRIKFIQNPQSYTIEEYENERAVKTVRNVTLDYVHINASFIFKYSNFAPRAGLQHSGTGDTLTFSGAANACCFDCGRGQTDRERPG